MDSATSPEGSALNYKKGYSRARNRSRNRKDFAQSRRVTKKKLTQSRREAEKEEEENPPIAQITPIELMMNGEARMLEAVW